MPAKSNESFFDVLTQAVADIAEHGFDSVERIAYWTRKLREAAETSLTPAHTMESMLRESLKAIYDRLVTKGGVAQYHPGISRFTLDKIAPRLRPLLDQKIMASANLIKLNRVASIEKTLQRFAGWSTSIPAGGTNSSDKVKIKTTIRKNLAQLPFEERRVLIDQGHKLTAAINEVIAVDTGAIALIWHSHWRQPGYNYREDHKERDKLVYLIKGNWAQLEGLVKPGAAGYYDDVTSVGEEVFCRCYAQYIYSLRKLPDDMLTAKGRAKLTEASKAFA